MENTRMAPGRRLRHPFDFSCGFLYTVHQGGVVVSRPSLYLLGPPRIERDGVPIKVDTREAIGHLVYVAISGKSHRRASLVNLLWPEYDRTHGRAALRRSLAGDRIGPRRGPSITGIHPL
jgi:hypothetical protein